MNKRKEHGTRPWTSTHFFRTLTTFSILLALSACSGGSGGDPAPDPESTFQPDDGITIADDDNTTTPLIDVSDPSQCNAATQKQWAYDSMRDFYLFYDQVPVVDPQSYASANDLVRDVRFQERDEFSHVTDATESALLFDEGREFGLGYSWRYDKDGNARITRVVQASPFARADIERGDIILSVDGLNWNDDDLDIDFWERVAGTPENPATAAWRLQKRDTGVVVAIDITAAEYAINTVLKAQTVENSLFAGKIGYLAFSQFLNTSESELNGVFGFFQDQNITDLVLDLRYNGGGRVSIAQQLASLIAGNSNAGQTIYNYRFNDKYPQRNYTLDFQSSSAELGLSRVIVLTSRNTASASEIVIAGLQPHMEVVTIGSKTRGKPYIQYAYDRCDERLAVIEAEGFNLAGNSVFDGIPAMCYGEDDPTTNFGVNGVGNQTVYEGLFQAGADYIRSGTCAAAPATLASRHALKQARADYRQGMSTAGGALAD